MKTSICLKVKINFFKVLRRASHKIVTKDKKCGAGFSPRSYLTWALALFNETDLELNFYSGSF